MKKILSRLLVLTCLYEIGGCAVTGSVKGQVDGKEVQINFSK